MTKIENEAQYDWAMSRIEELLPQVKEETPTDDPKYIELVLLSNLVADYDEACCPITIPPLKDVLKLRMYELHLSEEKMAEVVGIDLARMLLLLKGEEDPTMEEGRAICKKLKIAPGIILGADLC